MRALGPYNSLPEAHLVRARLGAHGIDAHVAGENASAILGDQLAFGQGFRVLIADADVEAATIVLACDDEPEPTVEAHTEAPGSPPPSREPPRCPICSAALLTRRRGAVWMRWLALLSGRQPPLGQRCETCGHRF